MTPITDKAHDAICDELTEIAELEMGETLASFHVFAPSNDDHDNDWQATFITRDDLGCETMWAATGRFRLKLVGSQFQLTAHYTGVQ